MPSDEVQELIRKERIGMARTDLREAKSRLLELQGELTSQVEQIRTCTLRLIELGVDPGELL